MSSKIIEDSPPTYQDALVQGVLTRSGRTPFPDAPRLDPRTLDSIIPETKVRFKLPPTEKEFPVSRDSRLSKEDPSPYDSFHKRKHNPKSSGWQSDNSHVRSSKTSPLTSKKKTTPRSPSISSSHSNTQPCTLQQLLAYSRYRPSLMMNLSFPVSRIRISGDIPILVRDSDLDQIATSPPISSMHIKCDQFSWPVHVSNKSGITYRDVIMKIRDVFYQNITQQEWDQTKGPFRERVKLAFQHRCRAAECLDVIEQRKGLRRVDLLCNVNIWQGLVPILDLPDTWMLILSDR